METFDRMGFRRFGRKLTREQVEGYLEPYIANNSELVLTWDDFKEMFGLVKQPQDDYEEA